MPSSPFRDEGERLRAKQAACYVNEVASGDDFDSAFDSIFPPIVDAPECAGPFVDAHACPKCGPEIRAKPSAPTPPDFDAALNDAVVAYASKIALVRDHPDRELFHERFIAARQRVRELYEAVVRERDALRGGPGTPGARFNLIMDELEKRFDDEKWYSAEPPELRYLAKIDALRAKCEALELALGAANDDKDAAHEALRAAQQGEVLEVRVVNRGPYDQDSFAVALDPERYPVGSKVRITRVEEAP